MVLPKLRVTCCLHLHYTIVLPWRCGQQVPSERLTFYQSIQWHIPDDTNIRIPCHKNLKFHNMKKNLRLIGVFRVMRWCSLVESYQCVWRNPLSPFSSLPPHFLSEDGGRRFLQTNGNIPPGCIMSYPRRQ
jgi:hypothetical protein